MYIYFMKLLIMKKYKYIIINFILFCPCILYTQTICTLSPREAVSLFTSQDLEAPNHPCRQKLYLIAGYLGEQQALYEVPKELRTSTKDKNAYDLALIRTGDPSRVARLKQLLATVEVTDAFVYETAPKLIYTRRREVIDFLFDEIMKDQRNCDSADTHTRGRINCAYRLLEMVAPVVHDFPLKVGVSGDLEMTDYPTALEIARGWIRDHRDDYRIVTDTF